jgi:[acyl-carrier-protein] S-malonyltransferase/trans-AT polyketide synthase/acyltransferase/oxidoreductase domain-containing protein
MARDFHERFDAARRVFAEASEASGVDLAAVSFEPDERLALTEFAQPAILTSEIAMYRSIATELGWEAGYFGGHSLGEYTALVASGALPLANAVGIVRERGKLMQGAVPVGRGSMAAVCGADLDLVEVETRCAGLEVVVANDNSREQVVLSGTATDLARAEQRITASDFKGRIVPLDVSAPFHSPLLRAIEEPFGAVLERETNELKPELAARVTSNYTGAMHEPDAVLVRERLTRQISGRVRWRDNMACLAVAAETIVEIGPGRPLRGFFKTMAIDVPGVTSVRAAERVFGEHR